MHPLAIFPTLLSFQLLAPLLLRLSVGFFILFLGWEQYHKPKSWLVIFYAAIGLLLIAGLYTQVVALVGIVLVKLDFWVNKKSVVVSYETIAYVMAAIILLSLLVTGPGFLALDLPL